MNYYLHVTSQAELELYEVAIWWADHRSLEQALRWLEGFEAAIDKLPNSPESYPVARENDAFEYTLRELHNGLGSKPTHRALFRIRGDQVIVTGIRHLAQRDVTPEDFA
mgnify:FL=1